MDDTYVEKETAPLNKRTPTVTQFILSLAAALFVSQSQKNYRRPI